MKPYPAYKDSGVEWLGKVPEGWELSKIRYLARFVGGGTPSRENPVFWGGDIPWVSPKDMKSRRISTTEETITEAGLANSTTSLIDARSVLIVVRSGILKHTLPVAISEAPVAINQDIRAITFDPALMVSEYFSYFIEGHNDALLLEWGKQGATVESIEHQYVTETRIPLPPLPEQQAIASFLDRETAKIDGLIEEQRRLIALLAEKRQATISHAVTRGLNPSTPLKPSGVDWLGDIPEGWEVVRLRRILSKIEQGYSPECFSYPAQEGEWGVLKAGCVNRGTYTESENKALPPEVAVRPEVEVEAGDVLMSRASGSPELIGSVAIVRQTQGRILLSDKIFRLKLSELAHPDFIVWSMGSVGTRVQIVNAISGGEGMANNLPQSDIKEFWLPLPPLAEQVSISQHIEKAVAQLDTLTETATTAITLLQERRAALISAAVTGKIDVRKVVKVPAQAPQSLHVSAVVAGVIIAHHGQHLGFGRMMIQKFLFMTQACANAPEIGGNYERQAAGPLDRNLQSRVEAELEAAGLVRVRQEGGRGSRVQYEFLGDAAALRAELASALGDRMERFGYLSSQLGGLAKNGIEAVSTLYAAWNDFLIDGRTPDRADIIREVLENWHPEKSRKFTADELGTWLDWMERQNIVPDGTGPQTQTGRLFP